MNKIIITVIFAGFGVQLLKLTIYFFRHKSLSWHDLVVTGGMPSSHSAFVISMATIIYLVEGVSTAFVISLVLAMIVIRDAFGVRRSVGNEGKAIEKLLKLHKIKSKFHYAMGHTPLQVFVGSLIGFVVAILVNYLF
ncbi:MAG: divergent PAP2 family protein [Nanoarchaeota archaeon]|nr:divergent PAP2 family protein [Nanoarchaeota archaeon]MBU1632654.1 divergent PAP2 family protein [Nanoarchaeota archaeon]MBU1876210.1 divergent PAP2 family protein [Nanoarchaeota archaeon]